MRLTNSEDRIEQTQDDLQRKPLPGCITKATETMFDYLYLFVFLFVHSFFVEMIDSERLCPPKWGRSMQGTRG